jgi:hypothetical protein
MSSREVVLYHLCVWDPHCDLAWLTRPLHTGPTLHTPSAWRGSISDGRVRRVVHQRDARISGCAGVHPGFGVLQALRCQLDGADDPKGWRIAREAARRLARVPTGLDRLVHVSIPSLCREGQGFRSDVLMCVAAALPSSPTQTLLSPTTRRVLVSVDAQRLTPFRLWVPPSPIDNSVNGVPSCANEWLLKTVAREEWYACLRLFYYVFTGSLA